MKKIIFFIAVLIASLFAYMLTNSTEDNYEYKYIKPKRGDIVIQVNATGKVYCESLVNVATLTNGEIKEFRVKLGDRLKKGDIIAVLDDKREKNALESEKSKLASLKDDKQASLVQLEEYSNKFETQSKLYKKGASSKDQYLASKTAYYNAIARLSSIKASIIQTKANIANLQENLDDTIVKSPIDGTVISVYASVGQTINSRQNSPTLIKLANLNEMEIRVLIPQNDILKLKQGQVVKFTPLSDGAKSYEAKLKYIDKADFSVVDGSSKDGAVYYYARFDVLNNKDLKIGMDIQNSIEVEVIKDVLTLPINYISKDKKGYYVNIKDDSELGYKQQYITLGSSDELNIEIKSGLKDDDEVVIINDKAKKSK